MAASLENALTPPARIVDSLRWWCETSGFALLIGVLAAIVYFDDIQITLRSAQELPTIYNTRLAGLKILDWMALAVVLMTLLVILSRGKYETTAFHRQMLVIFLVYCYAGVVGLVYSFGYRYDYEVWVQDFQQTIYLVGFFLATFVLVDSKKRWRIFVIALLLLLAAKNLLITYRTVTGVGKAFGDWAFRASQNSEFTYFPMMFFPLLLLLIRRTGRFLKFGIAVVLFAYLFNSLVGVSRTVWVMLIIGSLYLLAISSRRDRHLLVLSAGGFLAISLFLVALFLPKFISLAWNYKFLTIFQWSIGGDRSNATRVIEIINVVTFVFAHGAFLQGMGLGAWWDDTARRLLPDVASGFMYKSRFHTTHMWYLTQLLKIGLIGMLFYWKAVWSVFRRMQLAIPALSDRTWERDAFVGLHVGFVCAFVSSADFVRLFLMIGIVVALTARYLTFDHLSVSPAKD